LRCLAFQALGDPSPSIEEPIAQAAAFLDVLALDDQRLGQPGEARIVSNRQRLYVDVDRTVLPKCR
jgi:hypothetical protein